MGYLKGKVDVVCSASQGPGKDIAIALGEQGCIVWVTGRTTGEHRGRRSKLIELTVLLNNWACTPAAEQVI